MEHERDLRSYAAVLLFCMFFPMSVFAAPSDIVINEAASTGAFDFIELYNTSDTPLVFDDSWTLEDQPEALETKERVLKIPQGLRIEARGHIALAPYVLKDNSDRFLKELPGQVIPAASFTMDSDDHIRLVHDGVLIDQISWTTAVNSQGRYPDGSESITMDLLPTPGESNVQEQYYTYQTQLIINEICSRGIDFIELRNNSQSRIVIGAHEWRIEDAKKDDTIWIPAGTIIEAGGHLVIYPDLIESPLSAPRGALTASKGDRFGLSSSDTVILRYLDRIVDSYSWSSHVVSAGRYPDGSKSWDAGLLLTPGRANRR